MILALIALACTPDAEEPPTDPPAPDPPTQPTPPTDPPPTETEVVRDPRLDATAVVLAAEVDDNLASGVSIAVRQGDTLLWAEGFGTADPEGDQPIDPDTLFQIGSTTKQMTAALVLQQVEDGAMSLDDTVATLLPDVSFASDPTWASQTSVHQLLSHQGGSVDYVDWLGGPDDALLASWHEGFYSFFLYPMAPPGTFWNYSNPNFTVAGLAAEAHDPMGRAYVDMLSEDLFAPLGMDHTFARRAEVEAAGNYALSTGVDLTTYAVRPLTMEEVADPASVRPAGLVWSTPTDMTRWGTFLVQGDVDVLSDDLREAMHTPAVSTLIADDHMQYGYGLFVWDQFQLSDLEYYPLEIWEHGGNTLSMTSMLFVLPEHDLTVSILSNGYGDSFGDTLESVLRALVTPFPEATGYAPAFDPVAAQAHAGSYLDANNVGPIEITAGGAYGLQIAMPLLSDVYGYLVQPDLIPVSTDVWLVTLDDLILDLTFIPDETGATTQWIRNRSFVAEHSGVSVRIDPTMGPPHLAPIPSPVQLPRR